MCGSKNRCDNSCYCCFVNPICSVSGLVGDAKIRTKTKQSPKAKCQRGVTSPLPVYQVFQPLPLLFVEFQLFPPRLLFLHSHPLEEPSLAHGFGLRKEQKHVRWQPHNIWKRALFVPMSLPFLALLLHFSGSSPPPTVSRLHGIKLACLSTCAYKTQTATPY